MTYQTRKEMSQNKQKFSQKRKAGLLMFSLILGGIAVPTIVALADTSTTVSEENYKTSELSTVDDIENSTESSLSISEIITDATTDSSSELEVARPNHEVDSLETTTDSLQQIETVTEENHEASSSLRIANPGDYNWKLTSDGYWYAEGWGEGNKYLDTTVNFVDENGTVIETYTEKKVSIFHGVVVFLNSPNHSISISDPNIDFGFKDTNERWYAASYGQSNMTTDGSGNFVSTVQVDTLDGVIDPEKPEPNKDGLVTVHHVDARTGIELHEVDTLKDKIGKQFTVAPYTTIEGYSYDQEATTDSLSGSFSDKEQSITVKYSSNKTEEQEAKETLEKTLTDARPFVDKTKYQASYVDVLDKAIKNGEEALQETNNVLMRIAYSENLVEDESYSYHTNAINKALEDVKAHPLKTNPSTDEDGHESDNGDNNNSGGTTDSKDETNPSKDNSNTNSNNKNKNKDINSNRFNNQNSTTQSTNTKDLPQTGESASNNIVLAGIGTMLSAIVAWFFTRKRG